MKNVIGKQIFIMLLIELYHLHFMVVDKVAFCVSINNTYKIKVVINIKPKFYNCLSSYFHLLQFSQRKFCEVNSLNPQLFFAEAEKDFKFKY